MLVIGWIVFIDEEEVDVLFLVFLKFLLKKESLLLRLILNVVEGIVVFCEW